MNAYELADKLDMVRIGLTLEAAIMLRQQAQEIEALKKELALQKLFDIGQEIESSVGSNWWKGDPTCGGIAENYMAKKASEK